MKPRKKRATAPPPKADPAAVRVPAAAVLAAAALAVLLLLAYSNSFTSGFILDNKGLLLHDSRIQQFTADNIRLILQHTYWWPMGEAGLYRPITTLSFLFNYAILGNADQPAGYHGINFLLHTGNVLLVYFLMRRLLRSGGRQDGWLPFFIAAVWAVHPVLTESVTNMIGRSDLLAAMALLSGFWMYLKSAETTGRQRIAWLTGLMIVTAVGVFSKESAVVIPGVIVVYELGFWKERRQGRALFLGCVATLLPVLAMLYQRFRVLADAPPAKFPFTDNPIAGADFWTARLTAIKVIAHYLWLIVWPATLSSDYSYSQIPLARGTPGDWAAWIAVLAVVILAASLYWWNRTAFFWVCFAAVTFAPTSNLLFPIGTIMAERLLYVPAIGLLACAVMGIYALGERLGSRRFAPVALGLIVTAFVMRTWVRNGDWQNELSMAQASVSSSPNSFKTHRFLAYTLSQQPVDPNLDRALQEIEKSMAILDTLPDSQNTPEVYRIAGTFYLAKGDAHQDSPEGALEYQKALKFLLHAVQIHKITREAYERNGAAEWRRSHPAAQAINNADPETPWMLAAVYARLNNLTQASTEAVEALDLHPTTPDAYRTISSIFAAEDRKNDAAIALLEGMLITSDFRVLMPDIVDLYHNLYGANTCAIVQGPDGPTINPRCEMVRAQFCSAAVEALKAAVQTARLDVAREQKEKFVQGGCPAGPLDQVFPGS